MTVKAIHESVAVSATELKGGRIRIKIIDAGEGSSGKYPGSTIKLAAEENVFRKGLHMYADHPTVTEGMDRPERTIKDLAAVLETDAVLVPEEQALYAEAKVFPNWREVIKEMANDIGVSIRASAEVTEANDGGKPTIDRIVEAYSVDFVTKAGRGGKVTEVLESAAVIERAVEQGVQEATANDTRELLSKAVRDSVNDTSSGYAWVQDFDESSVWYSDDNGTYQRSYSLDGGSATLLGTPIEVRARTTYVPVNPAAESAAPTDSPSIPAGVTESRKEPIVATTNIEESALAALQAQASRASALEAENKVLTESLVRADAAQIVAEAFEGINAPKTIARLVEGAKLTEDGKLDADALKAVAEESAAEWRVAQGEGSVRGLGDTSGTSKVEEAAEPTPEEILATLKGA